MAFESKYFKRSEFACKCGCGFSSVDVELLAVLTDLREHFGKPTSLNCACRCASHNKAVGGAAGSKHLHGMAADVVVRDVSPNIVAAYLENKYPNTYGIGRYNTFTHIDVRSSKSRWDYRK